MIVVNMWLPSAGNLQNFQIIFTLRSIKKILTAEGYSDSMKKFPFFNMNINMRW